MVIGVDFDNTIISYDKPFRSVARAWGISLPVGVYTKGYVREHLRAGEGGELAWRRLQADVYGERIIDAEIIEGVDTFFRLCHHRGVPAYIVSHKTELAQYGTQPVNLRAAAVGWMETQGFFRQAGLGLEPGKVFFESSRHEKITRIQALKCTHFIDDLEEVLLDPLFPHTIERLLFSPVTKPTVPAGIRAFSSWNGICRHLFGLRP